MDNEMEKLFERAERERLWFYCSYQDLWFTPKELRAAQSDGRFRWGAVNWKLRDPREGRDQLRGAVESARTNLARFEKRMEENGNG